MSTRRLTRRSVDNAADTGGGSAFAAYGGCAVVVVVRALFGFAFNALEVALATPADVEEGIDCLADSPTPPPPPPLEAFPLIESEVEDESLVADLGERGELGILDTAAEAVTVAAAAEDDDDEDEKT